MELKLMEDKGPLIVCVGVILALAFPAFLYAVYKDAGSWVRSMGKVIRRARNPWKGEEQDMQELSRLVAPFKIENDQTQNVDLEKKGS
jgi:hypothetical protein